MNTRSIVLTGILDGNFALIPATSSLRLTKLKGITSYITFAQSITTTQLPYANFITPNGLPKLFRCLNGFVDFASASPIFRQNNLSFAHLTHRIRANGRRAFGNDETSNLLSPDSFATDPSQLGYQVVALTATLSR